MRSPARELTFVENLMHHVRRITFALLAVALVAALSPAQTYAQSTSDSSSSQIQDYITPRTDEDVPKNLSTLTQSLFIEVLAAGVCQLAGIDPVDPKQPCLGINPQTGKLGYSSTNPGELEAGGLLGLAPGAFSMLYTPTTSTSEYGRYLGQGFGIVKPAYADNLNGFQALTPVLELWKAVRNVAYMLLIIAFIFIGLGIMLRIKIDPRTVMAVQNQVPRIVICILLITFSYPIAGLMIDGMWLTTYAGINILTSKAGANPVQGNGRGKLSEAATSQILQTPLAYIDAVQTPGQWNNLPDPSAYTYITAAVSIGVGSYFKDINKHFFNAGDDNTKCGISFINGGSFKECVANAWGYTVGAIVGVLVSIIIFITLLVVLFRIWFMLLKAYVFVILYVIGGPIWIIFGLLPGRPLGFEKWMRHLFVNLMVFPLTAFVFVGGRVLAELFDKPADKFVAPLAGNPSMNNFGVLISFGLLLMGPKILTMLQESMKATGSKHGAAIGQGLASGAAPVAALANNRWKHWNRTNAQGENIGAIGLLKNAAGTKALETGAKLKIPFTKGALVNKKHLAENKNSYNGTSQKERNKHYDADQHYTKMHGGFGDSTKEQRNAAYDAYLKTNPQKAREYMTWTERRKAKKEEKQPTQAQATQQPKTQTTPPQGAQQVPPTGQHIAPEGEKQKPSESTQQPHVEPKHDNITVTGDKVTVTGEQKEGPKEGDHAAPTHGGAIPHGDESWNKKLKETVNKDVALHLETHPEIKNINDIKDDKLRQRLEELLREHRNQPKPGDEHKG